MLPLNCATTVFISLPIFKHASRSCTKTTCQETSRYRLSTQHLPVTADQFRQGKDNISSNRTNKVEKSSKKWKISKQTSGEPH